MTDKQTNRHTDLCLYYLDKNKTDPEIYYQFRILINYDPQMPLKLSTSQTSQLLPEMGGRGGAGYTPPAQWQQIHKTPLHRGQNSYSKNIYLVNQNSSLVKIKS